MLDGAFSATFVSRLSKETRAKFFAYNEGMHVIHVVGPKVRQLMTAIHDLSRCMAATTHGCFFGSVRVF